MPRLYLYDLRHLSSQQDKLISCVTDTHFIEVTLHSACDGHEPDEVLRSA